MADEVTEIALEPNGDGDVTEEKGEARSRSRSRSRSGSRKPSRSPVRSRSRSRSRDPSRSRSRSPAKRSRSPTPPSKRSRSRSGSRGGKRSRSRSRSPSRDRRRRSPSPRRRHSRSRSASPPRRGRKDVGDRDKPQPSRILGIFGLSVYTREKDLRYECERYGDLDRLDLIYDQRTGRSRGFGFVYFYSERDAARAKEAMNGMELDGRKLRVDFSITKRAHTPTPGRYMGDRGSSRERDRGYRGRSRSRSPRRSRRRSYSRSRSRSRSRRRSASP